MLCAQARPDILKHSISPKRQCGPVVTMHILSLGHVWRLGGVGLSIVPPFPPLSIVDVDCPLSPCPATPTTKQQKQPQGKYEGKSIWYFHVLEFNEAIISSKPSRHLEASCSKPYTGQLVDACPHHHPIVGIPFLLSRLGLFSLHRKQRDASQTPLARPPFTETDPVSA